MLALGRIDPHGQQILARMVSHPATRGAGVTEGYRQRFWCGRRIDWTPRASVPTTWATSPKDRQPVFRAMASMPRGVRESAAWYDCPVKVDEKANIGPPSARSFPARIPANRLVNKSTSTRIFTLDDHRSFEHYCHER